MGKPHRFTGETDTEYPTIAGLGTVKPGDVAYFDHRAPDARWEPAESAGEQDDQDADESGADPSTGPQRPAASALKPPWQEYVVALGMPAEDAAKLTKDQLVAEADKREAAAGGDGGAE